MSFTPISMPNRACSIADVDDEDISYNVFTDGKKAFVYLDVFKSAMDLVAKYQSLYVGQLKINSEETQTNTDDLNNALTSFNAIKVNMKKSYEDKSRIYKIAIVVLLIIAAAALLALGAVLIL